MSRKASIEDEATQCTLGKHDMANAVRRRFPRFCHWDHHSAQHLPAWSLCRLATILCNSLQFEDRCSYDQLL